MPYTAGGQVLNERSMWRPTIVTDLFWGFVNVIVLFFQTMFQPDLTSKGRGLESSYSTRPGPGDPPGGPRRRLGRVGRSGGSPNAPPMAGGG